MKRRGADCATMPAWSMAATKAAALPSMIGTSGPSISMVALSTPMPQCSKHVLGGRNQRLVAVAKHSCEFGGNNGIGGGADLAIAAIKAGADKNKTRIDRCRS